MARKRLGRWSPGGRFEKASARPAGIGRPAAGAFRQGWGAGPAIRRSGDPAIRRSGDPAIRRSGDPAIRRSGDPAIRRSGDPAIRRSGDPAIRRSGDPAIRRLWFWGSQPLSSAFSGYASCARSWPQGLSSVPGSTCEAPAPSECRLPRRADNLPKSSEKSTCHRRARLAVGRWRQDVRSHAGEHGLGNVSRMPVTVSSAAPDGLELLQIQVTCYRPLQMHESPRRFDPSLPPPMASTTSARAPHEAIPGKRPVCRTVRSHTMRVQPDDCRLVADNAGSFADNPGSDPPIDAINSG